jgi:allophanate hydrolase subunit 2
MCVGAVQITRDGLPVLIGPDGPTIGGYPKPACVIEADWNRMAQLVPGDTVAFQWI